MAAAKERALAATEEEAGRAAQPNRAAQFNLIEFEPIADAEVIAEGELNPSDIRFKGFHWRNGDQNWPNSDESWKWRFPNKT